MRTFALLLLAACQPVYRLSERDRTCAEPFLEWTGGLAYAVSNGSGRGDFDFDPADPLVTGWSGAFDLNTGNFAYDLVYLAGGSRVSAKAQGRGTIWPDGDSDLSFTEITTWADGSQTQVMVREKRLGCEESVRLESDGEVVTRFLTYAADGIDVVRQFAVGEHVLEATGRVERDFSASEELEYSGDGYGLSYLEERGPGGLVVRSFTEALEGVEIRGEWQRDFSGLQVYDYTLTQGASEEEWDFELDFDGDGSGSLSSGSTECELSFDGYACVKDGCGSSNGECQVPVLAGRG